MTHQMGLYSEYFPLIQSGVKTIEVRLNDAKRQLVQVGDHIEFIDPSNTCSNFKVQVMNLTIYRSFYELYLNTPFDKMGCLNWSMEQMIEGTYEIYSKAQEDEFGALAIEIRL